MHLRIAILLLFLMPGTARGWELSVGKVRSATAELQSVRVGLDGEAVAIGIGRLQGPDLEIEQRDLAWTCTLQHDDAGEHSCDGAIRAAVPAWSGRLRLASSTSLREAKLSVGKARMEYRAPLATTPADAGVRLAGVPLSWLQSRLAAAWPELASIGGSADADLVLSADASRLDGTLALKDVTVDSRQGDIAAAGLNLQGRLAVQLGASPSLQWRVAAPRGQLLVGPVYFELPDTASTLALGIDTDASGAWQLPLLDWDDGAGLHVKAAAHSDDKGRIEVRVIDLVADLASVAERYLASALATAGFDGLALAGALHGSGRFVDGAWQHVDLEVQGVKVTDPGDRLQVGQLDGSLHLDTVAADNSLHWRQARVFALPLGDGAARWTWSPERLQLSAPLTIAFLGGSLRLADVERLRVDDAPEWRGAIELDRVDLQNLTTALDWPPFSGTLSGRLPGFRFRDGGFTTDGDIQLGVFGGKVRVSGFSSERTFGVAPSLGADIAADNLDLKQLSSVLDFGEIEGWLDGEVRGLRMLDWAPVAFDARLRTDKDYPRRQRISQRAVQGLSSVGGGGSAMGNPMMRLVDSFGYAEIGLNCVLLDNVCQMGGLDRRDGGYTILRGAGIPRLTVVGHQQRVDWPVLLTRLQAVSSGQAPVIE